LKGTREEGSLSIKLTTSLPLTREEFNNQRSNYFFKGTREEGSLSIKLTTSLPLTREEVNNKRSNYFFKGTAEWRWPPLIP
jgi:hypothetical protein